MQRISFCAALVICWLASAEDGAVASQPDAAARTLELTQPVPEACARLHEQLQTLARRPDTIITDAGLRRSLTPACRDIISAKRWPELTRSLSAAPQTNLRAALCSLNPPDAGPIVRRWLLQRDPVWYDPHCAALLLRFDRRAFERFLAARLRHGTAQGWQTASNDYQLSELLEPTERVWLIPALEEATRRGDADRDRLYASICSAEPARSAPACAQSPPVLQSKKPNKWLIRLIAAATYVLAVFLAQRRWGRDRVGWAAVPGSMAACFALSTSLLMGDTAGGPLGALNQLWIFFCIPVSLIGGVFITALMVRRTRFSPAAWAVSMAVVYLLFAK